MAEDLKSALDRLRALRVGKSIDGLPMDWRAVFEEWAAIFEYDDGLSREEAESQALREIAERRDRILKEKTNG